MFMSFCCLSMELMALPNDACGARLKLTVIDGNCPWWVIDSGSVVVSKWENALKGMALLGTELVMPAVFTPAGEVVPDLSTLAGGVSSPDEGVYSVVAVNAFDPAEVDPAPEELDAPAPVVPAAALAWM
jgi:hypothetical protein